jgi:hypothetical protein
MALASVACIGASSTLTSCNSTSDQIQIMVLPTVKMFTDHQNKNYVINDQTSIAVNLQDIPKTPDYPNNSRQQMAREIFQNIAGEYYAKLLGTKHSLTSHPEFKSHIENTNHEISFTFFATNHLDDLPEITSDKYPEAYQIDIGDKITIKAFNEQG